MSKILFFVLIFIEICCSSGNSNDKNYPSLEFSVDDDLVTSFVTVKNSFNIKIPKSYDLLDSTSLEKVNNEVRKDETAYISLYVLKIFQSKNHSSCVISLVNNSDLFSSLNEEYYISLQDNFETDNIVRAQFSVNSIHIIQYIITNNQIVTFKLFFNINDNFYQIDYFIPYNEYEKELKKIESSIGSISLALNKEVK